MSSTQAHTKRSPHPTLDDVKSSFIRWRRNPNRSRRIPEELWDQVVGLLPHYPKGKVISVLAIGPDQLEQRLQQQHLAFKQSIPKTRQSRSFVKAAAPYLDPSSIGHDIVLSRANGATLKIAQLHHNDLIHLIEQFCEIS